MKKANILMLYPSIMEIEQKSDVNSFWRSEWKRVKEDISDFKALLEYIFQMNWYNIYCKLLQYEAVNIEHLFVYKTYYVI